MRTRLGARAAMAIALLSLAPGAVAATVTLGAVRDTTLFSENAGFSSGAGDSIFAGRTGGTAATLRRGLIAFDVAGALPAGAIVQGVELTLRVSRAGSAGSANVSLHRVLADWGEAGSVSSGGAGAAAQAGDATWTARFFPGTAWTAAGGDFAASASAAAVIGDIGNYTWGTTASMVADVQRWLDTPGENFGWLLRGDEARSNTARRFDSSEAVGPSVRAPELRVTFAPIPEPSTLAILLAGLAMLGAALSRGRRGGC